MQVGIHDLGSTASDHLGDLGAANWTDDVGGIVNVRSDTSLRRREGEVGREASVVAFQEQSVELALLH